MSWLRAPASCATSQVRALAYPLLFVITLNCIHFLSVLYVSPLYKAETGTIQTNEHNYLNTVLAQFVLTVLNVLPL